MNAGSRVVRGAAIFALAGLCIQGCKKTSDSETSALVTVQAEHPEVGEISEHIMADAMLFPLAQAAISPKITAPVREFYVQRGSKVKAGDLLAVLENRDLTAQAMDNKGQYSAAEASYNMQTKAQVPEDYRKAELDLAQAKAQLNLQEQITASREKLLKEGAMSRRTTFRRCKESAGRQYCNRRRDSSLRQRENIWLPKRSLPIPRFEVPSLAWSRIVRSFLGRPPALVARS
jgi:multidrug efflux pump subunit AcrA (membrane-fusion protein)